MPREHDLQAAATAAGLIDHDLLRLALPDASPAQAIADLRRRYPTAFPGAPKMPKDMTWPEIQAEVAGISKPAPHVPDYPTDKTCADMTLDEVERFERFHGIHPDPTERRRREQVRARMRERTEMGL